ncbi:beta-ketoacyl synthase N-terminal-like domain-containing protein, partial [Nocardia tengchongensis]|uniref:beta-ketoacyl synthase N-terminal-like domain-containing protein n=1 Tax=Nocardia tengchongensis TaxID=2055889 RepID=UPI0036BED3E3
MSVPIAVVGLAALMPQSPDLGSFWRHVVAGRDLVTEVPSTHWPIDDYYDPDPAAPDKTYSRRGAFLPEVDFDPIRHGMPPTVINATDTAQLLALVVADRLMDDLNSNLARPLDRSRTGVILGGATLAQGGTLNARIQRPVWLNALRGCAVPEHEAQQICDRIASSYPAWDESSFPGYLVNLLSGRIANRLELGGTNFTVDAACASSMAAIRAPADELALGRADVVLTGGIDAHNTPFMFISFSKTPALSPTGVCRPFADAADGTVLGEGIGMLALKRLEDAKRDGDSVYAVMRGLGSSSDGRGAAIYAPVASGQAVALRRAYADAGYGPETVELIEAHGTATAAGDAAEIHSLKEVFAASGDEAGWCALGSVKSQIGHTKAAAGAAGMIKAVLALRHQVLPPTINVDRPSGELADGPFYVNTRTRPWIRSSAHPRRASVSSSGFGGTNFHAALEEYIPAGAGRNAPVLPAMPAELVLVSGADAVELSDRVAEWSEFDSLARISTTSLAAFDRTAPVRLSIVAADLGEFVTKAARALDRIRSTPEQGFTAPGGITYSHGAAVEGRIAFLFPGQGAQYPAMGESLATTFPEARAVWDLAADLDFGATALHRRVFPQPAFTDEETRAQIAALTDTRNAQPALAAHSLSLLALLRHTGIEPDMTAGHSLGELVALHAAGVLDPADLLRLARKRGELMAAAATEPGAMTAVAAAPAVVQAVLDRHGDGRAWTANHNKPDQVVVSGATAAIDRIEEALAADGITYRRLNVATAFHSPLVAAASDPLAGHLADVTIGEPRIPVFGNADARPYPGGSAEIRDRIARQVAQPVRFVDQIEAMYAAGARVFVEVGAGGPLTPM